MDSGSSSTFLCGGERLGFELDARVDVGLIGMVPDEVIMVREHARQAVVSLLFTRA